MKEPEHFQRLRISFRSSINFNLRQQLLGDWYRLYGERERWWAMRSSIVISIRFTRPLIFDKAWDPAGLNFKLLLRQVWHPFDVMNARQSKPIALKSTGSFERNGDRPPPGSYAASSSALLISPTQISTHFFSGLRPFLHSFLFTFPVIIIIRFAPIVIPITSLSQSP